MSILIEMGLAKRCCDCGELFPLEQFQDESHGQRCRLCNNDYMRRYERDQALKKQLAQQSAINKL